MFALVFAETPVSEAKSLKRMDSVSVWSPPRPRLTPRASCRASNIRAHATGPNCRRAMWWGTSGKFNSRKLGE
jgi:hypothetical protein